MNVNGSLCCNVNIGLGNGLVLWGNKPSEEEIIWANVDPDLCQMASLGHKDYKIVTSISFSPRRISNNIQKSRQGGGKSNSKVTFNAFLFTIQCIDFILLTHRGLLKGWH